MLVPYKTMNQKIAMGLLSFMPKEKEVKKLQKTIERYENDPNWKLYLWKEDDFVGVIGVTVINGEAYLQHLCVNPSYRQEGIGKAMLKELQNMIPCNLHPTSETKDFLFACDQDSKSSYLKGS
jgi:riboflavin biosynthesis RibT protein